MPLSFYVKSGDEYLAATLWFPKSKGKAGLVFCHGWGGGAQYDDLLEVLAHNGYFAMRFQQRGYGNSTGQSDLSLWVEDMAVCASVLGAVTNKDLGSRSIHRRNDVLNCGGHTAMLCRRRVAGALLQPGANLTG